MQDAHYSLTCANQPTFKLRDNNALQNLSKPINSKKIEDPYFLQNTKSLMAKNTSKHKIIDQKKPLENFKKNRYEKKSTKSTKSKKLAARGVSPQPHLINHQG